MALSSFCCLGLSVALFSLTVVAGLPGLPGLPHPFNTVRDTAISPIPSPADIVRQLGPQLSPNSSIFTQGDPRFENATARWQEYDAPSFEVVVMPGTEQDVQTTVRYANSYGLPFLAVNRAHGSTKTLGRFRNGIQIHLTQLDQFTISADGTSAFMQGGVYSDQVTQTLWDAGYVTVTGSCGCIGVMGPGLGGGFGRYQGFYGLTIDELLSMNVVLADGSAITVSEKSYPDLWWAMRGAGHNFGIVTSFHTRIHPRLVDEWFYIQYIFSQDKLEPLFELLNSLLANGGPPKEVMNDGFFAWMPQVSTTEPVIVLTFYCAGTAEQAAPFIAPFTALGPDSVVQDSIPYPEIADATGTGSNTPLCQDGLTHLQFGIGLLMYNVTTMRQVYDFFKDQTLERPAYNNSIVVFEGFSRQGVKAVDPASTAYPHREDELNVDTFITYPPNSSLDEAGIAFGERIRQLVADGQPARNKTVYVNYAFGDEPLEEMYGYQPWRLQRLRAAKERYDPYNRFGYYNPITL